MKIRALAKKLAEAILKNKYANKKYYSFFYFLYLQGLRGMDYGFNYVYPETSGEFHVLTEVAKYYKSRNIEVVFFDVGANTGYYAKQVLAIFGQVDIYCFEPSSFTYQQLVQQLSNRVKHYQLGLSSEDGEVVLHLDKDGSGMASISDTSYAPPFGITSNLEETIQTVTLDNFLYTNKIEKVHFLKMDVEGHEYHVLEGATNSLNEEHYDFIQFEFGRVNIDSRTPLKLFYKLLSDKYRIYRIVSNGLIPQFEYNYEYEIYLGTNFLAVKKQLAIDLNALL